MKKIRKTALVAGLAAILIGQSGCLGSFKLTMGVYDYNLNLSNNKFVNNLVFWAANIIPVYGFALLLDVFILNLVEFWTGENPISMKEGEMEEQYATIEGIKYKITATKNKFKFEEVVSGKEVEMIYTPENTSWNVSHDGELIQMVQLDPNDASKVNLFLPGGEVLSIDNTTENLANLQGTFCASDLAFK